MSLAELLSSASSPRKRRRSVMLCAQNMLQSSDAHSAVTRKSEVIMGKNCCTCLKKIENENAPVLAMGAYGTPRLLCDDCAALIDTVTLGRDYDEITAAMQNLTDVITKSNVDDRLAVSTVTEILEQSAKRAQQIKEGTYDFSLDEVEEEGFDEIPEELQETEEDRLLDQKEAESNAKFDKFMNWLWIGVGALAGAFIIWKVIDLLINL